MNRIVQPPGERLIRTLRSGPGAAIRGWTTAVGGLLFPPKCAFCSACYEPAGGDSLLCETCRDGLAGDRRPRCSRCCATLSDEAPGGECLRCRKLRFRFDRAVALGTYENDLRTSVLRTKQDAWPSLGLAMGRLLAERALKAFADDPPEVVAPIPMYWSRRLVRGVNSPELMAEAVASRLGLPLLVRLLVRSRNTLPQFDLPPRMRQRNVHHAFRVRVGYDLQDARVLIVDDILTTGATANDAARALKDRGARHVAVAVVARTESPSR